MSEEKLPEYLQTALKDAEIYGDDAYGVVTPRHRIVAAIHRFAREREAAALERAETRIDKFINAQVQRVAEAHSASEWERERRLISECDGLRAASGIIRALIHKEPANGR